MKKTIDIQGLIRPDLVNIQAYSSARDEFSSEDDMIFLDANENPFNTNLNRYPDPYQSKLKSRLAEIKGISKDLVVLGNGSDEIIDLLVRLFCTPFQDSILIFPPTYGMYKVVADLNAVKVKSVYLDETFQLDASEALRHITQETKLIFLCTPNNPSGNSIQRQEIFKILEHFDGIVVIDEAYIDFSNEGSFVDQLYTYENLVVMQTFSKAYGLAGARLGMCFANRKIVDYLNKIKPPYNINQLTQNAALERLNAIDEISLQVDSILKERLTLEKELKQIPWIEKVFPSQSNFFLVKVDNANKRYQQCLSYHIVVRNRHTQPNCENCLRFTIGTAEENTSLLNTLRALQ